MSFLIVGIFLWMSALSEASEVVTVRVGSKNFTESQVLAEIIAQRLEQVPHVRVERRFNLGATAILHRALKSHEIDLCSEYTGTLAEVLLKRNADLTQDELKRSLLHRGLVMSGSLGFNNTYGLAVSQKLADQLDLQDISDLKLHPHLRIAISHEFSERRDGWKGLRKAYGLEAHSVREAEHVLGYAALKSGQVDVVEVYTTDAKIQELDLKVLNDNFDYFPKYDAVFVAREDWQAKHPDLWEVIRSLEGSFSEERMRSINALVDRDKLPVSDAARRFFADVSRPATLSRTSQIIQFSIQHLKLVFYPMALAIIAGSLLGFLAHRMRRVKPLVMGLGGVVQTIPSLALLCFLVPIMGIGELPAYFALFLYALFPILVSTHQGLMSIDQDLRDTAKAMGLKGISFIWQIELPLALPFILAGVRTSVVQSIGTATIAALVGAGGLGALIVRGLTMDDMAVVLMGAIPSGLMAVLAQGLLTYLERHLISAGLRAS